MAVASSLWMAWRSVWVELWLWWGCKAEEVDEVAGRDAKRGKAEKRRLRCYWMRNIDSHWAGLGRGSL
jgi:hypothetical protein